MVKKVSTSLRSTKGEKGERMMFELYSERKIEMKAVHTNKASLS